MRPEDKFRDMSQKVRKSRRTCKWYKRKWARAERHDTKAALRHDDDLMATRYIGPSMQMDRYFFVTGSTRWFVAQVPEQLLRRVGNRHAYHVIDCIDREQDRAQWLWQQIQ